MLKILKTFICLGLFCCAAPRIVMCADTLVDDTKKRVLILNSYHPGYYWTDQIMSGIRTVLDKNGNSELLVEYMDTKRHDTKRYFEYLINLYKYKYLGVPMDIIISTDDHALDFLLEYRSEIFPDIPIVFCGIDKVHAERLNGHKLLFGIEEDLDVKKNLEIALELHPDTRTVAVISDRTKTGLAILAKTRKIESLFKDRVRFEYMVDQTIGDLQEALEQLPPDSVVLYLIFTRDKNGSVLTLEESMEIVGRSAKVPVYITWEVPLKKGIMGGYVASGFNQGTTAALAAAKILSGPVAGYMPVVQTAPHINLFNFMEMERFGLSESDLPQGVIFRNAPYSFYRENKSMIWGVISAFIFLFFVVMVLLINILQRKKAEIEVLKNEERLKTILETANEGFLQVDASETIVGINAEMCKILDRSKTEIINHSIVDFLDNENAGVLKKQQEIRKRGKQSGYDLAFRRRNGELVYCIVNATPMMDEEKRITGSFAMVTDITDRKKVEKDLMKNQKILRRSESMFRAISEFADLGIVLFNHCEVIYSNKRLAGFMGVAPGDLTWERFYAWILNEDLPFVKDYLQNLLKGHYHGTMRFEMRVHHGDKMQYYRIHAQNIEYDDEPVVQIFLDDITEQKEMERKARLNDLKMYHEDRLSALGVMATGIAHELNQPLNAIRVTTDGFLYAREEQWGFNPDEVYEDMEMISRQIVRMADVIRNIRNFAREDTTSNNESIDPNSAIEHVFSMIGRQLEIHGVTVETLYEPGLPKIEAKQNQLEQVVMNLVINARQALKACSHKDKMLWVKTGLRYDQLFIEVGDNGGGIQDGIMKKIFDPFFTTKDVGKGTGLGLAISQTIISELGGQLKAYNNKIGGATFFITIPCRTEK